MSSSSSAASLPYGPLVTDVLGLTLDADDRHRLMHPLVGGVILFARNYHDNEQLRALCAEIRGLRTPALPISVDHEGGRVQRFRQGFTSMPPMRKLGHLWDQDQVQAIRTAESAGIVIGAELTAHGVDFSFTPVLDLDYGSSGVIGDRALHHDPKAVGALGAALVRGLAVAGVAAVGKHFPGHGHVVADSHIAIPIDERGIEEIMHLDVAPYVPVIAAGLTAIMPAHVIYPQADAQPAGFSRYWLQHVLREQLGFSGIIFSDDLGMEGASTAGDMRARAVAALQAGCDSILLCNSPNDTDRLLDEMADWNAPCPQLAQMCARSSAQVALQSDLYRAALQDVERLMSSTA